MKFEALDIHQAVLVRLEPRPDSRGFFARSFCEREFAAAGLPTRFVQSSISFNERKGTLRGLHFQWPPSREAKLVRCTCGAVDDVLLDLRPQSPTYLRHATVRLDTRSRDAVFIPHGVAHGFQTLEDATEVLYQMTDFHAPELAASASWDDPAFGIAWSDVGPRVMSERDASCPPFDRAAFEAELARRGGFS